MSANVKLQKSLMLLDRGQIEKGEQSAREAIDLAEAENDRTTLVTALCMLGDLLWQEGRPVDAVPLLERVVEEGSDHPPFGL